LHGDEVTFIGSSFIQFGHMSPYLQNCIVLGSCDTKPNIDIVSCRSEQQVLCEWSRLIRRENPDIMIGYNIFGFDYSFMFYRAQETGCLEQFLRLSRNNDEVCCSRWSEPKYQLDETLVSLASGQYELKYIKMTGRIQIDLYTVFRREENLVSYKLDYVSGHFIGDYIKKVEDGCKVYCSNMTGLAVDSYVHFDEEEKKYLVKEVLDDYFVIEGQFDIVPRRWGLAKDDVTPQDIFRMAKESDASRFLIAKYCLQDCNLLHHLMQKIDVLTGYIEMSAICSVPISFLVFRGQGIKLTSYVAKKCRQMKTLMKVLPQAAFDDDGYEGATVLEPKCNLYLDNPVACVDYASLYPSSMISENLSHDTKIWTKEFDLNGQLLIETGTTEYDGFKDLQYVDITYDTYKYIRKSATSKAEKVKVGYKICRFAQNEEGIMPMILKDLLHARKTTRALIKTERDDFMKNVLDKRQLGYKVTANTFYDKDIAASTTATGRMLLIYAKTLIETVYGDRVCVLKSGEEVVTKAEYIYGDTDSVFFTFNLEEPSTGVKIRGERALKMTIELAQEAGELASMFIKSPHDLEYEKTFMPFCLLSKKRYVGMLYELDPYKCKRKEMGIVLKRRDNAPIVKDIYGGIIDILMKEKNIKASVEFLKKSLQEIRSNPIQKFIISKSLRSDYKNPDQIAHKVLADRITSRDPGNKPNSGDRIPYVYIVKECGVRLQGDRIETPTFIQENHLKIDYSFYITNQIMKPVQQLFALVLEDILLLSKKNARLKAFQLKASKTANIEKLRNDEVRELLFDPFLQQSNQTTMMSFFSKV
jgi:DNA polymerase elongation subunit (family B)